MVSALSVCLRVPWHARITTESIESERMNNKEWTTLESDGKQKVFSLCLQKAHSDHLIAINGLEYEYRKKHTRNEGGRKSM